MARAGTLAMARALKFNGGQERQSLTARAS
jgi:hypothetical protein